MKIRELTLLLLLGVSLALAFLVGFFARDYLTGSASELQLLTEAQRILNDRTLDPAPNPIQQEYGMIRGLAQSFDDPYTFFVEPVQHELQSDNLAGKFGGIGVEMDRDEFGQVRLYPFDEGPAARAGLLAGDILRQADELAVSVDTDFDSIRAALRGPLETSVAVQVSRTGADGRLHFEIERAEVPLPSLTWRLLPDYPQIGLIALNVIAESSPLEVEQAWGRLQAEGATALILDLRNNGGGLLDAGVNTARLFLESGTVIEHQYRDQPVESWSVEEPGALHDVPLVILVNKNTASAAEILAGSLQAQGRAVLIGQQTLGKDSIQLVFTLADESSLHVTAARWWIPGHEFPIELGGLRPDIPIEAGEGTNSILSAAVAALEAAGP